MDKSNWGESRFDCDCFGVFGLTLARLGYETVSMWAELLRETECWFSFVIYLIDFLSPVAGAKATLGVSSGRLWLAPTGNKIETWLILPVVICLSQRLSHACLSINNFVLWNCEWLIKSVIVYLIIPYYLDNRGNSRANTCNQIPTSGRDVFIR